MDKGSDLGEELGYAEAEELDGAEADECDERDEQRVLHHRLTVLGACRSMEVRHSQEQRCRSVHDLPSHALPLIGSVVEASEACPEPLFSFREAVCANIS